MGKAAFSVAGLRPNGISDARQAKPGVDTRVLEGPLGRSDWIAS